MCHFLIKHGGHDKWWQKNVLWVLFGSPGVKFWACMTVILAPVLVIWCNCSLTSYVYNIKRLLVLNKKVTQYKVPKNVCSCALFLARIYSSNTSKAKNITYSKQQSSMAPSGSCCKYDHKICVWHQLFNQIIIGNISVLYFSFFKVEVVVVMVMEKMVIVVVRADGSSCCSGWYPL